MRAAPPLLPIFRSNLQGQLLAAVLLCPEREESLTALAHRTGGSLAAVQREIDRLERAGVVRTRRVGNTRLVTAAPDSPLEPELSHLVLKAFGPVVVISTALQAVPGVTQAFIFGSWAARYLGEGGAQPGDIDVLVIGRPDRDDVDDALRRAGEQLGLPVNAVVRSPEAWNAAEDPFARSVKQGPIVDLDVARNDA